LGQVPALGARGNPQYFQGTGVLVVLLPYLEGDNIFKQTAKTQSRVYSSGSNAGVANGPAPAAGTLGFDFGVRSLADCYLFDSASINYNLARTKVKMFLCPSDTVSDEALSFGVVQNTHEPSYPTTAWRWNPKAVTDEQGRTNYAATAGCWPGQTGNTPATPGFPSVPFANFNGVLGNRTELTLGQLTVQDGTSNTTMFGEGIGGNNVGVRDTAWGWFANGAVATYWGIEPKGVDWNNGGAGYDGFSAQHATGPQFCFADGSVRTIRTNPASNWAPSGSNVYSEAWYVFQMLVGKKDGMNLDRSILSD